MKSRVCITVSNSPNPSRVYIRLRKHGKRFLLLKYKPYMYVWHVASQKLGFLRCFGQKTGIDFAHLCLESGTVLEGTRRSV